MFHNIEKQTLQSSKSETITKHILQIPGNNCSCLKTTISNLLRWLKTVCTEDIVRRNVLQCFSDMMSFNSRQFKLFKRLR